MITIQAQEFVRRLKSLMAYADSKYAFFLGSGCSASSGIPDAKTLVKNWLPRLKKLKTGSENGDINQWVREAFSDYEENKAALFYGNLIDALFLTPEERQKEIEALIEGKDPSTGYAILAQLMSHQDFGKHCNIVLTTNFDDLVSDALYVYTNLKPLTIVHESLVGFVRISRTRPLVIKLHGDAKLAPKNTKLETEKLHEAVQNVLKNLLAETGLIFVGYGGNDKSILSLLRELPKEALPWGIYWVGKHLPDNDMAAWLESRNAVWVDHHDFDQLMFLISSELAIERLSMERFGRLFEAYMENREQYARVIKPEVFDDTNFLADTASFFILNHNYLKAQEYYEKALEIDPNSERILNEYAIFLEHRRKNYDKAEKYYRRAIEVTPNNATLLGNYANFLRNIIENFEKAEEFYRKALAIEPDHKIHKANYAGFLLARGRYEEGFRLLRESIAKIEMKELLIECLFYQYAHARDENLRSQSIKKIKRLIELHVRAAHWNFRGNIAKAVADGHPHPKFLEILAEVILDHESAKSLEPFGVWQEQ